MSATLYLEGGAKGPDSKEIQVRCREGFRKLLQSCGFGDQNRMPRLFASGGRDSVFDDFQIAHSNNAPGNYVAMWIDSEEPLVNIETAWRHLENVQTVRKWQRPAAAKDDQVLFMATCMETWLVADRAALKQSYGHRLNESSLPPLNDLEQRSRQDVQASLTHASRDCSSPYAKGKKSFEILSLLHPATLQELLPSFARVRRVLDKNL